MGLLVLVSTGTAPAWGEPGSSPSSYVLAHADPRKSRVFAIASGTAPGLTVSGANEILDLSR